MNAFRSLCLTLVVGVCCLGMAAAQQEGQAGGAGVQVPDGKPDDILKFLKSQRRPGSAADFDALVKGAEKVTNHPEATEAQKTEAHKLAIQFLYRGSMQFEKEMGTKFEDYTNKLVKDLPNTEVAGTAISFRWAKKYLMKPGAYNDAAEQELWQIAKTYPKHELVGQLFGAAAQQIQDEKKAIAFMEKAIETFGADSPIAQRFKGELINKKIIGSEMEIVGPTLKGESFNIASLKGKVVLVDYWATWCGPCVAELPNVKKVYEKYKDKGFEIVAVSLDFEREPLEKFVKEKELPWTQIIFADKKDMGWTNPLARKYGINGIPAMFLIGRDGKVVARDLRGEALEKAVAEQIEKSK